MSRAKTIVAGLAVVAAAATLAPAGGALSATTSSTTPKRVTVADDYYAPVKVTIRKGQSIKWVWSSYNTDSHNVTLKQGPLGVKRGLFKSATGTYGINFQRRFRTAGTYRFLCTLHRTVMRMTVVVKKP